MEIQNGQRAGFHLLQLLETNIPKNSLTAFCQAKHELASAFRLLTFNDSASPCESPLVLVAQPAAQSRILVSQPGIIVLNYTAMCEAEARKHPVPGCCYQPLYQDMPCTTVMPISRTMSANPQTHNPLRANKSLQPPLLGQKNQHPETRWHPACALVSTSRSLILCKFATSSTQF